MSQPRNQEDSIAASFSHIAFLSLTLRRSYINCDVIALSPQPPLRHGGGILCRFTLLFTMCVIRVCLMRVHILSLGNVGDTSAAPELLMIQTASACHENAPTLITHVRCSDTHGGGFCQLSVRLLRLDLLQPPQCTAASFQI